MKILTIFCFFDCCVWLVSSSLSWSSLLQLKFCLLSRWLHAISVSSVDGLRDTFLINGSSKLSSNSQSFDTVSFSKTFCWICYLLSRDKNKFRFFSAKDLIVKSFSLAYIWILDCIVCFSSQTAWLIKNFLTEARVIMLPSMW